MSGAAHWPPRSPDRKQLSDKLGFDPRYPVLQREFELFESSQAYGIDAGGFLLAFDFTAYTFLAASQALKEAI
jgi:hypothetical protein